MNERLVESVKRGLEYIESKDLEGDIYGVRSRSISYGLKKGEIADSSENEDMGLGIRVIKDGKLGFGYAVPEDVKKGVDRAVELSKYSAELNPELPSDDSIPDVEVFDEEVKKIVRETSGGELAQQMLDAASEVAEDIIPTRGGVTLSEHSTVLGNTTGLFLEKRTTGMVGSVMATIKKGETSLSASESQASRKADIDFQEIGREAGLKVDSMRESSGLKKGKIPVVIEPDAFATLLWFGLVPAVYGEEVRKGKSVYQGKKGEKVASESLTLADDPTKDWGLGSGPFDDEGVISQRNPIIKDGMLENFLYDMKDASKCDTESTGNGIRGGFKSSPSTVARNLVLEGEEKDVDEMMPDEGLYVDSVLGAHTANPVSGDFSVVTNPVWLVENGEKKGRIDGAMISGNIPDILDTIELGDDHQKSYYSVGSAEVKVELPTARLNDVTVSGK